MVRKTTADILKLRDKLAAKRRDMAFRATEVADDRLLADLASLQSVIAALDAVMAEGGEGMDVESSAERMQAVLDMLR